MTKGLIDRRSFVFSSTLLAALSSSTLGWAANAKDAEVLVEKLVAEINAVISSGNSESVMVRQFEEIFKSYADVPTIARYAFCLLYTSPSPRDRSLSRMPSSA